MLMDSGSTYNFIDQGVVKRMNGMTKHVKGMKVTVANGKSLRLIEVCRNLTWEVHGLVQFFDFMILPLIRCDSILNIQWLRTLGPITWDFQTLKMQFQYKNIVIILYGLKGGAVQLASKKQLARMYQVNGKGTCTILLTEQPTLSWKPQWKTKSWHRLLLRN